MIASIGRADMADKALLHSCRRCAVLAVDTDNDEPPKDRFGFVLLTHRRITVRAILAVVAVLIVLIYRT